jgi:hypothetical protein
MKITIGNGEELVFIIHEEDEDYGKEIDVPLETVERWRRIVKEFNRTQDEIGEALDRRGLKL